MSSFLASRPLAAAKRPARDAYGLGRQAIFSNEFKQRSLVASEMIEDRQMEAAVAEQIGDAAAIQPGQSEKARQPILVAGEIAEREERNLLRQFGAIFTIRRAFH